MLADALAFEQQRPQPQRTRRRRHAACALDRHCISPCVGHRGIAGNTPGEPRALPEVHLLETLLDALVLVAEPLFETQDALADDGEAEMSRFDRAGMHRPDGNFVHAFAFDADEWVCVRGRLVMGDW